MKFDRSVWIFLIVGIALRCVAITQPLVDAHLIRQCQTAAATKSLIEEPGFHLSSRIPWLGDLDAHYIQELPIYNFLVMGVHWFTSNLDLSGKVTSILLWAVSFVCLQFIWRRALDSQQVFWANLVFVIAPLSVFYGQAFMPEMLVQCLAFGFILLALRYNENPSLIRWSLCAGVGLTGSLVKLPEVGHLYLILAFVVIWREGWKALIRPRYLVAALLTIVAIKGWSSYVDSTNATYLPEWTSRETLRYFVGPLGDRLQWKRWTTVFLYVGAFIVPGPATLAAAYGMWAFLRKQQQQLLGLWLGSLIVFYLLWFGNTAAGQSYYNLPALAPLCALFGIGMRALFAWGPMSRWRAIATTIAVLLVVLPAVPVWQYLFKKDLEILEAALWVRANTNPNEIILFRPNHRWDMIDYPYNPAMAYYSERPTFVWTGNTPETYRRMALERASYAVVTLPQPPASGLLGALNRFRKTNARHPESMDWLEDNGFRTVAKESGFVVFRQE